MPSTEGSPSEGWRVNSGQFQVALVYSILTFCIAQLDWWLLQEFL